MLSLLMSAIIASAPPMTIAPQDQPSVDRCRAHAEKRLGTLGEFNVTSFDRRGRMNMVRGTLTELDKAPPAEPGMMRPNHVVANGYAFTCELRARAVHKLTLSKQ